MLHTHRCPKCGAGDILRIPDTPGRYASGNNIYTSSVTLLGKIPVIRHVCLNCGYTYEGIRACDPCPVCGKSAGWQEGELDKKEMRT